LRLCAFAPLRQKNCDRNPGVKILPSLMQPVANKLDRFFIPLNDRFMSPSENNPAPLV
jgi:hypothetical protein